MERGYRDEETVKVTVRLPAAVHERLVSAAQHERRSLNAQIIIDLERVYALRENGRGMTEDAPPR